MLVGNWFVRMRGVLGVVPERVTWLSGVGIAAKFGIVGVISGAAFSTVVGLVYRGRRLSEINWVRFGIAGGVITGIFVPLFLQTMNLLSGDGLVPWRLVLDDAVWTAVLGAVVAGGSIKLAQRADRVIARRNQDRLDGPTSVDRLASAREAEAERR